MRQLNLRRLHTANGATVGVLSGLSRTLYTLEEAWRENQPKVSSIPAGTYQCVPHGWETGTAVSKPKVWQLLNVPGRSSILIHIGNTTKDTEGCILAGMGLMVTQNLSSISDSRMAIELMRREIGENAFTLTIE
ncbi:conserved hypothetical protein [Rhizobium leguminosarum bv. trifolii WSM2304]|uniref:DUF5675 domain-containing protein n=1 Tax=Rhizobium leguminosarum bv. trifolii (strain WSM2304) TaxID=395492 RepID=A0ABF7QK85_RHILW|nr:DUF5675 family protein [Rhizobium leguminosarum]ACI54453.1 conserved hypothetical protein [Rhizobium leguminosarum bv. trifolii WSM2304]